jgi:hypothetical protein
MKVVFYFSFVVLLSSCFVRDNPKIKIINNTNETIDSIEVFAHPINKTVFRNIKSKETVKGVISFEGIPKQDGSIGMFIYNNGQSRGKGLSYYTLGASLDYGFKIYVENDTIIVENTGW